MNLKLSKILASALVTGLMAISGHAVAGNAVVSAAPPFDDHDAQHFTMRFKSRYRK